MKTVTRMLSVALTVCLLLTLASCGVGHNAAVYNDRADEWINDSFAAANLTSGIYIEGADTVTDSETYPRSRTFIVDTQERCDEIFKPNTQLSVNLETEMLVVCTYTSTYVRPVELTRLRVEGDTLSVTLREKQKSFFSAFAALPVGAACQPYQRYVILKLDRLDVTNVELTVNS